MAALTATDWSCSVQSTRIENKARINLVLCTLATAGSYPSNGIPVPTFSQLGFKRNTESINIIGDNLTSGSADSRIVKYDDRAGSVRLFTASDGAEVATTVTAGTSVTSMLVQATGW